MQAWLELRRLPRRVWVVSVAAMINRMGTMALPFLTLYLTRELGWPATRAALIVTLYGTVAFGIAPFAGRLADRWGASTVMRASITLSGLSMLVFPLARGFWSVAAMTVAWAVVTESFRPANMTAVTESVTPEVRKQAYALHRAGINLGMSMGPALGGWLATLSFKLIWLADGLTSLAAAAVLWTALEDSPRSASSPEKPTRAGLRDARLLACLCGAALVALVFFQHESALPLDIVRRLSLSPGFYGLMFTVNTLLIVAFEIPLNHATRLWPHRRTLVAGALLIGAGFGGYGLCSSAWQVVAATVVWSFGEMTLFPGMTNYIASLAPEDRRGEYMGLYLTAFSVGFMLGPWSGVALMERCGAGALWLACGLVGALAALVFAATSAEIPAPERESIPA